MRFYVYSFHVPGQELPGLAFVYDPESFALKEFNPAIMEFTGVAVEANDIKTAEKIYERPGEFDPVFACDEPKPMQLKRKVYQAKLDLLKQNSTLSNLEKQNAKIISQAIATDIALQFNEINVKISELSRYVRLITDEKPEIKPELLYERLKQQYAEQLIQLPYRERPSSDI